MVSGVQVDHHQKENSMQQFKLGKKAIQTITRVQVDLARFSKKERTSILRYLLEAVAAPSIVGGVVRAKTAAATGTWKSSRARKLSRVAKARTRDANGHFIPTKRQARRVRTVRAVRTARAA